MANATYTEPPTPANTGPSTTADLKSLASTFLSFTASGDWAKILIFGWILETCRRHLFHWRDMIMNRFWITASFDANDYSYGKSLRTPIPIRHILTPHGRNSLGSLLAVATPSLEGSPLHRGDCAQLRDR